MNFIMIYFSNFLDDYISRLSKIMMIISKSEIKCLGIVLEFFLVSNLFSDDERHNVTSQSVISLIKILVLNIFAIIKRIFMRSFQITILSKNKICISTVVFKLTRGVFEITFD